MLKWDAPSAIHGHWIVERSSGENVRLGYGHSPRGDLDLGIRGQGHSFHVVQGERGPGSLGMVVLLKQCSRDRKAVV